MRELSQNNVKYNNRTCNKYNKQLPRNRLLNTMSELLETDKNTALVPSMAVVMMFVVVTMPSTVGV